VSPWVNAFGKRRNKSAGVLKYNCCLQDTQSTRHRPAHAPACVHNVRASITQQADEAGNAKRVKSFRCNDAAMSFSLADNAAVGAVLLLIGFVAGYLTAGVRPFLFRTPWNAVPASFRRSEHPTARFDVLGSVTGVRDV
jgi:hypothetical protein